MATQKGLNVVRNDGLILLFAKLFRRGLAKWAICDTDKRNLTTSNWKIGRFFAKSP